MLPIWMGGCSSAIFWSESKLVPWMCHQWWDHDPLHFTSKIKVMGCSFWLCSNVQWCKSWKITLSNECKNVSFFFSTKCIAYVSIWYLLNDDDFFQFGLVPFNLFVKFILKNSTYVVEKNKVFLYEIVSLKCSLKPHGLGKKLWIYEMYFNS
jgi:hypothetical protein